MSLQILNPGQVLVPAQPKRLSFSTPYSGPLLEPNTWLISFLIAALAHVGLLFAGKYLLVQPPEYGIQGSVASMEVYMVAALPEPVKKVEPRVIKEAVPEVPEAPSEMTAAKKDMQQPPAKIEPPKQEIVSQDPPKQAPSKSEVKGDRRSENPGENETTLFAKASSETLGKTGKYKNPPPQYPVLAERNGWEGTVLLKAYVEREGRASQVLIDRSSGFKVLDNAALRAVQKWKFEPGRLGSTVVSSWVKIPVRFRIDRSL